MITNSWFFDAMLYIYALSLLFTFSDFIQRNQRAKQTGTGLLVFVWIMQTIFLISQLVQTGGMVSFSIFDSLFLFSWLLISLSIALTLLVHIEFVLFLVSLAGFIVATIASFDNECLTPIAMHWEVGDELLFIHVLLAVGSYAAFFCSAIFSGMLLFLHGGLKKKRFSITIRRMPSLDLTQRYATRAVMVGAPLLLLSLILGIVWIMLEREWFLLLDVKVISSSLILIIYGIYIWKFIINKTAWHRLAILNIGAFLLVFLSYIASSGLSKFH